MTDEQIAQKAKKYARKHETILNYHHDDPETDFDRIEAAYLAGAHSRDKEIKEFQKHVEQLKEYLIDIKNAVDNFLMCE
jgi:predicted outer membrane protein